MDINSFKSNSNKDKKEKKLEKMVRGEVKVKKKTATHNFFRSLLAEDAKTIENHMVEEVVKPKIKEIIFEALKDGLELALFGNIDRKKSSSSGYTSYGAYYKASGGSKKEVRRTKNEVRRTIYDLEELEFEYREEAEAVLDKMCEILQEYSRVSGSDLCELLGREVNYTDRKYGWTDLSKASIDRIRGGTYVLTLPRAEVLE